jgi:hypothetical protein
MVAVGRLSDNRADVASVPLLMNEGADPDEKVAAARAALLSVGVL